MSLLMDALNRSAKKTSDQPEPHGADRIGGVSPSRTPTPHPTGIGATFSKPSPAMDEKSTLESTTRSTPKSSQKEETETSGGASARTIYFTAEPKWRPRGPTLFYGVLVTLALVGSALFFHLNHSTDPATAPVGDTPEPSQPKPSQPSTSPSANPGSSLASDDGLLMEMAPPRNNPSGASIVIAHRDHPSYLDSRGADEAYRSGDLETAQRAYQQLLKSDPHSRKAMLGLAAIAAKRRDLVQARDLYLRLLDRDPNDPLALAGLLTIEVPADPRREESRLKSAIANNPDAAPLYCALGQLYTREERWSEAREAYLAAFALDERQAPSPAQKSPEISFNIAVASEHLGRYGEALSAYDKALFYARQRKPEFDPALAQARIRALTEL